jgi:hypothetical protein
MTNTNPMKRPFLASLACFLMFSAFPQSNNAPVAVDDTVEVMSQVPVLIDVLANDYDPDGDEIMIELWEDPVHGIADTIGSKIRYKSSNYTGDDKIYYRIIDQGSPPMPSLYAEIYIKIIPNPHIPVANYEYYSLPELEPAELDILSNDTDPEGDELKICYASASNGCGVSINADSSKITVTPPFSSNYQAYVSYTVMERNTAEAYISNPTKAYIKILKNNDIPVLGPDTAYTTGGVPVTIPVLDNDYDRQGEAFEIFTNTVPGEGTLVLEGDDFIFTPFVSREGPSEFTYSVRETFDPLIYSEYTRVRINVYKNPDCPVGVADQASGVTAQPMTIDVLSNDYDPNGKTIEIWDVDAEGEAIIEGNRIIYTSGPLAVEHETIYYRVRQTENHNYYSRWTPVYIDMAVNPELPVAVDDHINGSIHFRVSFSPAANDIKNAADSLVVILPYDQNCNGEVEVVSESVISYQALTKAKDHDTVRYIIRDKHEFTLIAEGKIYVDVAAHHYYDSLEINNINAGVNADGMLFADVGQIPGQSFKGDFGPHFKYPAGAESSTIFNSMIWIGGLSEEDSLHLAGEKYRQIGADFQPGPVSEDYDSNFKDNYWKLWKLNRIEIEYHRNNWWIHNYQPVPEILSWPGDGDVATGQAAHLAPYKDYNQDGNYNPVNGDYPLIRGDQAIYFIMNDDKIHTESNGKRLKVEIHGMVYGFDDPEDSALFNTVFVHYDLINRSGEVYHDVYIGIYTDFDLGYPWDDYIGSEVNRSSFYVFNGDELDESIDTYFQKWKGYGNDPPAQSVTVLAGPLMDADGIDNPPGGCDFSVNGINFGNSIIDDERFGLTGFALNNFTPYPQPTTAIEYYYLLNGLWYDKSRWQFGGNGHESDIRAEGLSCNYLFPGNSDSANFGTGCLPPNPPYNHDGFYWTDSNTNVPGDRNGLGIMGPFTFNPGDIQEIELAYVVANGWNGPVSSVNKLMEYIDSLRYRVSQGEIIVPNDHLGTNEILPAKGQIRIYPNPAGNYIFVEPTENFPKHCEYSIYDLAGRVLDRGMIESDSRFMLNIGNLESGFYILLVQNGNQSFTAKFIKR